MIFILGHICEVSSNKEYKQKPSVELLVYFLTDGIAKLTVTSSFVIKLFGKQS